MKENVLLFKNHNEDKNEFIRADNLILWQKEPQPSKFSRQKAEKFNYEIEGHNPHWKIMQTEFYRRKLDNIREAEYMDYQDYDEIDKHLRMVIHVSYS